MLSTTSLTGNNDDKSATAFEDQILLQPYNYLDNLTGKKIRLKLAESFNYWLQIPQEKLNVICEVVQMLHNASLLIDDIEDNSTLRRGKPVAHNIFGISLTLNSANYVYFLSLEKVLTLHKQEAVEIFCKQLLELHRGQGMELYWRESFICPSQNEYIKMISKKTGGLFDLAVHLMQLFSTNHVDFSNLTQLIGMYFQVMDDYCNICSPEYSVNKNFYEDLTEGKFSFPIIHAISSHPDDMKVMSSRTQDVEVKKLCIQLLKEYGSLDYTKAYLNQIYNQILKEILHFEGNPHLSSLMEELRCLYQSTNK